MSEPDGTPHAPERLKVYAVSMGVTSLLNDATGEGFSALTQHSPMLVAAASMHDAAEFIYPRILEKWKPDEGWRDHQATFFPVTKYVETIFDAWRKRELCFADDDEEITTFQFHPPSPAVQLNVENEQSADVCTDDTKDAEEDDTPVN